MQNRLAHPIAAFFVAAVATSLNAQKAPALADVLTVGGAYLAEYTTQLSAIAAEENYVQYDVSSGEVRAPRRLSTDIVFVALADGIEGFRDVVAVDGAPLRARGDRLPSLFNAITDAAVEQARAITREGIDRYVSVNLHGLDQPMLALEFLRRAHQARSTFKLEAVKTTDGARVAVLRFTERDLPRLIPTPGDAAATGRLWVDVASGVVRQTELSLTTSAFSTSATVTYALQKDLAMWLPAKMTQHFRSSVGPSNPINYMGANSGYNLRESFEAHAAYSKYRRTI